MRKVLKIKWENIIVISLFVTNLYGWFVFFNYENDIKMLIMMLISTLMLLMMIFGHKTIATFRKEVLKFW